MESIFHEKQEGSLCAQHCLNALLQGHYFTPVDLAEIAKQLDDREREQMAEGGLQSEGYRRFLEQPSSNFDDSGFFSVQVIDTALRVWGLELLPFNSQNHIAKTAQESPVLMDSYICNFREHWLTIRKLGNQWFNLNSLLVGPELLSDTYLSLFLTQLKQEGYSIFIVTGDLMECEADQVLKLCPAVQRVKPRLISETSDSAPGNTDDPEYQQALESSKELLDSDDKALQKVLQMSMEGYIDETIGRMESGQGAESITEATPTDKGTSESKGGTGGGASGSQEPPTALSPEEMRLKRLAFLTQASTSQTDTDHKSAESVKSDICNGTDNSVSSDTSGALIKQKDTKKPPDRNMNAETNTEAAGGDQTEIGELSEEDMLKQAIAMSMEAE